ncbi:hypothetical protein J2S70_000658 [Trueperella bonasi]|uniref:Uncharacterized protein n=1 Tax=Trueperella bonasi TaxID=312286 RepID=A0ABT9NFA9_9ACTO|nr:DUF222 domain-containing protein [Trueperella bonasi]MDP9806076.1 hypothetical protein [Trueperella bonasi]
MSYVNVSDPIFSDDLGREAHSEKAAADLEAAGVAFDPATYEIDMVIAGLDVLAELNADNLEAESRMALLKELATQRNRLSAIRHDILAAADSNRDWVGRPMRTLDEFESQVAQNPHKKARDTVHRAKAMREDLPLFMAEAKAGRLSE